MPGPGTGAGQDRKGLLRLSSGGTALLDEVAELTPRAQAKLLRVLQDGEIRRLGENRTQRLDLRPLDAEAAAGRFRRDLLYRLNVVGLTVPPLTKRRPDLARQTDHAGRTSRLRRAAARPWHAKTVAALAAHPWLGNVRELQNVLANLTITGPRYGPVGLDALPSAFRRAVAAERRPTLAEAREDVERTMVRDALGRHGSVARAAGELGVNPPGPLEADGTASDRPVQPESRAVVARSYPVGRAGPARPTNADCDADTLPGRNNLPGATRAVGVTEERPLRRETAGFGGGRSRHHGRRNTGPPARAGGRAKSGKRGVFRREGSAGGM